MYLLLLINILFASSNDSIILKEFVNTNFESVYSTKQFPISIGADKIMANPDENYNATDVVDTRLSSQRLIFAGKSDSLFFVYYEQGGIGYSRKLILIRHHSDKYITVWVGWTLFNRKNNIKDLKAAVIKSTIMSESEFIKNHAKRKVDIVEEAIRDYHKFRVIQK